MKCRTQYRMLQPIDIEIPRKKPKGNFGNKKLKKTTKKFNGKSDQKNGLSGRQNIRA